jgi:hypothetical protein
MVKVGHAGIANSEVHTANERFRLLNSDTTERSSFIPPRTCETRDLKR